MRCPDCNKFVPFDTEQEPEIDLSVDDAGVVSGTVRIVNACAECGQELTEATLDIEIDLSAEFGAHVDDERAQMGKAAGAHGDKHTPELGNEEASRTDRIQTHDRHGRKISRSRYAKRYYGADVTATITCSCGSDFETQGTANAETQASGMDALV